jgi:aspartate racemase
VFPLSYSQESLWLAEQLNAGSATYSLPEAWRVQGTIILPLLRTSLTRLLGRHESLRTVFTLRGDQPVQVVREPEPCEVPMLDLSQYRDPETELNHWLQREARRAFDLANGPLFRAGLFRLGATDHVLFLNQHHLVSDAWSQTVLMRELSELYSAALAGRTAALPELPIQYADFAVWQRGEMERGAFQAKADYWQRTLGGPLERLVLLPDRVRPPVRSCRGETQLQTLPRRLMAGLKDLSRNQGATLFMTLLAGFSVLLHRHTRLVDIVVGSPMAGRQRPELESLIGFFVNTHALRINLAGDPSFLELLGRARETVLGAYANQEVPLERVVAQVQHIRSPGLHPLFPIVFGLQSAAPGAWHWPGAEARRIELDNGGAKFDWTLLLTECEGELRLRSEHSTDLFESATIRRLARQYQVLLEEIVKAPGWPISRLPLITPEERVELLAQGGKPVARQAQSKTIPELFEDQAARSATRVAIAAGAQEITYGELNRHANDLAHRLRKAGVGPGAPVAVLLERSPEMIVALLAILKAGGFYVPLDRSSPQGRLTLMLQETQPRVLLTDGACDWEAPAQSPFQIFCVAPLSGVTPGAAASDPPCPIQPEDLAYVMYTSGSTGTPKGVAVPHRGVTRLVRDTDYVDFSSEQVFLQLAPLAFDASTLEIWGALLNGAKLVIAPPGPLSLEEIARTIREKEVTVLWLTAGLFHQMVDSQLSALSGLKYLLAGGDVLSVPHVVRAKQELKSCILINGYGPTENTTFTCCYRVPDSFSGGPSVPIGRPIPHTEVLILDVHQEPVPRGMPGELYAGGKGLARGYHQDPALTEAKFLPHPYRPGERVYRTGDLARWLADGNVEFLGRLDEQVKIRGYRVEPKEIECVLAQHPGVQEAAVVTRPDHRGEKQLVGYVVPRAGGTPEAESLRSFLAERLPGYLVPAGFVTLKALPLTPNGKVDRKLLPAPVPGQGSQAGRTEPRTPTERTLAELWHELLGGTPPDIHANFFHLGGHSLLATQLCSRIAAVFRVNLPLSTIFESPTIATLATALAQAQSLEAGQPECIRQRHSPNQAAELLTHLDQLSDREVEELLADPTWKQTLP